MKYLTGIREDLRKELERIEDVDILVGLPTFNVEDSVSFVIEQVGEGLNKYWGAHKSLILISDGGSVDDTREKAMSAEVYPSIKRAVGIYRGLPGKGSAVRTILEAGDFLDAKAVLMVDSDLHSINPDWMRNMVDPILNKGYDYVSPYYKRFKYDGTITNNIAYMMIRALYGKRIRQPIGGDFSFSGNFVRALLKEDKSKWNTDIARFGIDTWITTNAVRNGFKLAQTRLGAKLHEDKDPSKHLGPMFTQVVATTFNLMKDYSKEWSGVEGSEPVEIVGEDICTEPREFEIDFDSLFSSFNSGYHEYNSKWKKVLNSNEFNLLEEILNKQDFTILQHENWARIVYDFATSFYLNEDKQQDIIDAMLPLYNLRVLSLSHHSFDMGSDEFETLVEEAANAFEQQKVYLKRQWGMSRS